MKALPLLLGGVTVCTIGAAVFLHLQHGAAREQLSNDLAATRASLAETEAERADAIDRAEVLAQRVATLEAEATASTSRLEAADARALGLARDLDALRQTAVSHEVDIRRLQEEKDALTAELVQTRLAPATIDAAELDQARQEVSSLKAQVAQLEAVARQNSTPPSPPDQVRVLSVGPENAFVVLDFGARQGAAVNQLLLVRRGSAPLATVAIRVVHARHAIAHVLPDSLQGSLRHGDAAILLN